LTRFPAASCISPTQRILARCSPRPTLSFLVIAGATPRSPAARSLLLRGLFYAATIAGAVALFLALLPAMSACVARRVPLPIEEQLAFPVHSLLENRYCRSVDSHRALVALVDSLRLEGDPGLQPPESRSLISRW